MIIERLESIIHSFSGLKVIVIGDIIIDHYFWGDATRISPEAPVPVVTVLNETDTLGGAGNVALNAVAYQADVTIFGTCGNDVSGKKLAKRFQDSRIKFFDDCVNPAANTIMKSRVFVQKQQLCRLDKEDSKDCYDIPYPAKDKLFAFINNVNLVIISDYAKGVITDNTYKSILESCERNGIFLAVDPKPSNQILYKGASLMTPNKSEAAQLAGIKYSAHHKYPLHNICLNIYQKYKPKILAVTLGDEGIALSIEGSVELIIPTLARDVYDVSGAGDTVIASMALALASGASPQEAAIIANAAAGVVVGKVGTAVVSTNELLLKLKEDINVFSHLFKSLS